jgi:hypothetical protein
MLQVNGIDQVCDWRSLITNLIVAAAYNMGLPVRSKKMAHLGRFETVDIPPEKWSGSASWQGAFFPSIDATS